MQKKKLGKIGPTLGAVRSILRRIPAEFHFATTAVWTRARFVAEAKIKNASPYPSDFSRDVRSASQADSALTFHHLQPVYPISGMHRWRRRSARYAAKHVNASNHGCIAPFIAYLSAFLRALSRDDVWFVGLGIVWFVGRLLAISNSAVAARSARLRLIRARQSLANTAECATSF